MWPMVTAFIHSRILSGETIPQYAQVRQGKQNTRPTKYIAILQIG